MSGNSVRSRYDDVNYFTTRRPIKTRKIQVENEVVSFLLPIFFRIIREFLQEQYGSRE